MKQVMHYVPTQDVTIDTVALRRPNKESDNWKNYLQDIKANGILQPLLARRVGDRVVIIDGGHRFEAAKDLGIVSIPCNIVTVPEEHTAPEKLKLWIMRLQISSNVHRFETKPAEYAKQVLACVSSDPSKSLQDWAEFFNKSITWMYDRLRIAKMCEQAHKLADEGAIKPSNLIFLARLPEDEQPEWIDKAQTEDFQTFVSEVNKRLNEINRANRGLRAQQEWQPTSKIRSKTELKDFFRANYEAIKEISQEERDAVDKSSIAYNLGMFDSIRYAISLDDESCEEQRAKHDQSMQEKELKKLRKTQEASEDSPENLLASLQPKEKRDPVLTVEDLIEDSAEAEAEVPV